MTQSFATSADTKVIHVAVAGNPNSGKTTIFNGLTGMRLKVGNYPGVSVERQEGRLRGDPTGRTLLIDIPGTYSLAARSLGERIARDALLGWQCGESGTDAAIIVLDASNLARNLYLATQILDLNLPVVLLCNMMDIARSRGLRIDLSRLSEAFGVPVLATVGNKSEGLDQVAPALQAVLARPPTQRPTCPMPEPIERQAARIGGILQQHGLADARSARGAALLLLLSPSPVDHQVDKRVPYEVDQALEEARADLDRCGFHDLPAFLVQRRYEWLDERLVDVVRRDAAVRDGLGDRIDRVLTHRVFGMAIFALIMFGMFAAIFWLAEPAMAAVERVVTFFQALVHARLPAGPWSDLLADGIIAGVGNVVVFFPQICLLFLFIAVLEDTGYMARAAFLMDRIMRRVGLHGKSFIPLLSCMACTVPGIMATRTIENRRDRLATILVAPLISCSARLPIYFILVALIFPPHVTWTKAGVLAGIYFAGILAALSVAMILKKTVLRGPAPMFVMELPPYRLPTVLPIARVVWDRGRSFLARAGTFILAASVLLWAVFYWPRPPAVPGAAVPETHEMVSQALGAAPDARRGIPDTPSQAAARQLAYSLGGRLGKLIEPLIEPLGYDWRIGVGIIASFTAREIFVSTMGIVYSVDDANSGSSVLRQRMQAAVRPDGSPVFSRAACLSLLVFYILSMQCVSTLVVAWRESGSWRWPALLWLYMTALAYVGAFATYHVAAAFGLAGSG
jgi:ferrous iron transport protein B